MVIVNVYDYPSQGDSPIGEGVSPGSNLGVNWFQDGLSLRSAAMSYTIHAHACVTLLHLKIAVIGLG